MLQGKPAPWAGAVLASGARSVAEHTELGYRLMEMGRFTAAKVELVAAINQDDRACRALFHLAAMTRFNRMSRGDMHLLKRLRALAAIADDLEDGDAAKVFFALGKALDDLGAWDEAMAAMHQANHRRRRMLTVDIAREEAAVARYCRVFDAETMARLQGGGQDSDLPVFIVGMPRSGTTLVEQILAAHPKVQGAGELTHLPRLLHEVRGPEDSRFPDLMRRIAPPDCGLLGRAYLHMLGAAPAGKRRITDKLPGNFQFAGLIHLALPGARIIHCGRDPRDACLSMYFTHFGTGNEFTYDLSDLGRAWRAYERLMAHWEEVLPPGTILHVEYQDLVGDLEAWARRLVAFCGLDWDPACLAFYDLDRPVSTASAVQVRRPIYASSVGRWMSYVDHLGPLLQALQGG